MAFSDNIWWTRKSKIRAEKRILENDFQAQVILLWYSFAAVAASVYYLKFSEPDNDMAGISWVVYSVLVLCVSGFVNGLSFKQRAGLVKECYETLSDVYRRARQLESTNSTDAELSILSAEYEQILGVCENHLTIDYYIALCEATLEHSKLKNSDPQKELDRSPTRYIWCFVIWYQIKHRLILTFFYLLPVVLFLLLESST